MTRRVLETVTRVAEPHQDCRTAEQMTDICCENAGALPCCEKVEAWTGYSDQDFINNLELVLDAQGRDEQGRYVEIRRLPRSQPCGEKVTRYDLTSKICCEGIEELAFDAENSVDVIADNSYGIVTVTGGKLPLNVSVRGSGFWLDAAGTFRDGTVAGRTFAIHTKDACGSAEVTVSDGCSVVEKIIMTTEGQWVSVPLSEIPESFRNVTSEPFDNFQGSSQYLIGKQGQYRVKQYWSWGMQNNVSIINTDPCFPGTVECSDCCNNTVLKNAAMCARSWMFPDISTTVYVVPYGYPETFKSGYNCITLSGYYSAPYQYINWYMFTVSPAAVIAEKWVC